MNRYIRKILEANVYEVADQSPLELAPIISTRLNRRILLKREDLQPIFSFKVRGAFNKIRKLVAEPDHVGVITASAGNHAQGVALAAAKLGTKAVIVMGKNTPDIKVDAVNALGAKVILTGESYDEAAEVARQMSAEQGYTYVHPFDDEDVIAGQGTIGMEIMRQCREPIDAIFVPVGGGGLIAGIAAYVKYLRPDVRIIGVEAQGSACMTAALNAGKRVSLKKEDLDQFADGTAVRQVGKHGFEIARQSIDQMLTVTVDQICAAIKDIFEETRVITEPAGALALAGIKHYLQQSTDVSSDASLIAVVSGANVNFDRLRYISERSEAGEKREMLLGVTIPEKPGSFQSFCKLLGKQHVTEFNYRYRDRNEAQVLVGIQSAGGIDQNAVLKDKLSQHYSLVDLSSNEVAALHVRHMGGGPLEELSNERLYRFEFPERPGSLLRFLKVLGRQYNITLFHYRNHGAAFGRVFIGLQIPNGALSKFRTDMRSLGYRYWEETHNPACDLFLRPSA
ncbi:MAG: threonine ammonia-lyase, biosynthetic [Gammaproteobacteria bacterium]|nr:threonine ammonia-lyase, biosynthetic [Gammaproteobacteria bacterium]MBT5204836.1 threonine ammonia-lyase, biosynthetic [Gammaproteobacteria bacterium]MBT5601064.1 threonine ammonia-lyase, biosynthetic [Gammaproteobacteria bacterium]MBT6246942.1 threonine ammonia-lyase, biosynthetic [Gammaproteobacteria bacterium]